jgi:hypothetical protein
VRANYTNTVTQIKRLLGRKFSEPEVQHEVENFLGYKVVQLEDDEIGIQVGLPWSGGSVTLSGASTPCAACAALPAAWIATNQRLAKPLCLRPQLAAGVCFCVRQVLHMCVLCCRHQVNYNDVPTVFTPQQIAGMFFSKMRDLVQVSTGLKGCDMVVSVPPYYTDAQRHAVLDACKIGVRWVPCCISPRVPPWLVVANV